MYVITPKDKQFLRDFSKSSDGRKLASLLVRIKNGADSIDGISSDHAAHVEGRKIVKKIMNEILDSMEKKERNFQSPSDDVDDYE